MWFYLPDVSRSLAVRTLTPLNTQGIEGIVAFYPSCSHGQPYVKGWTADVPVFLQMGRQDRVPYATCVEMGERQKDAGRPVEWKVYEGKGHNVDIGEDPTAREERLDSIRFLHRVIGN